MKSKISALHEDTTQHIRLITTFIVLVISIVILRTAWVSDDAFITFRVIENWWNGEGLRWNINERVWVYTHPLWLLLLSALYPFSQNLHLVSIIAGAALTLLTVWLILRQANNIAGMFLVAGCMVGSSAFIDYATSGLENSLGYLLVALFTIRIWIDSKGEINWFILALLTGLGILTRPDLGAFFLPAMLIMAIAKRPKKMALFQIAIGFLPLFAWESFAILYYGSLIPNTALAKLNHGITTKELLPYGVAYFRDALTHDPITIAVLVGSLTTGFIFRRLHIIAIILPLTILLIYVTIIGGDYMRGRFFAIPFVVALTVITIVMKDLGNRVILSAGFVIWLYLLFSLTPLKSGADFSSTEINSDGIADERGFYFQHTGILNQSNLNWQDHTWAIAGTGLADNQMVARCNIGMFGYSSPATTYIIDPLGLSEAFLARLPVKRPFRIGHFERSFPSGYLRSKMTGENHLVNPKLHALYGDVMLITQAPLWSSERLAAIARVNVNSRRYSITPDDFDVNATGEGLVENPQRQAMTCMGIPGELQPELHLTRTESVK
jgi:arabinofuranosyltransferase